jgi:Fe-S oxidoreductase
MSYRLIPFLIILTGAIFFLSKNLKKMYSYMMMAQPENRFDHPLKRIFRTLSIAIGQSKIMRDKTAGIVHICIFWGFLIFLFSATESVGQGFYPAFSWNFLGYLYSLITFTTEIFTILIVIGIFAAIIRRFVIKIPRLQGDADERKDALIVLGAIFTITLSLIVQNATGTYTEVANYYAFRPVSIWIGHFFSLGSAEVVYEICWWIHIIAIFSFANYLPFSKHFHVYTSIPNVYFSQLTPVNSLKPINFEEEGVEKFGVVDFEDLTWKNVLDSYTCTHCNRCTSVCPAKTTGKILSPREIIVQIKERTMDKAPILQKIEANKNNPDFTLTEAEQAILEKKFIGDYESVEALWQCTTCGACMQECPVAIEHVPTIVGMRRSLVMMESNFPAELQGAFTNFENNASPWAFSPMERADWAEGHNVKTAAELQEFDVLFWVGCAGSFDDRAKKVSVAFSELMNKAGINFAILGTEEQCNGDTLRRSGNEYLADMLVKANIATMGQYKFNKIVTTCPHCFNTFKNDYPLFGTSYEVVHHTIFLQELLEQGKLKLKENSNDPFKVTYHDSCYLGRYNSVYSEPREVIKGIPGLNVIEPRRNKDRGLCCGAGGGQMYMEELVGKRVNIERTEELLESNPDVIALNCPFCMTMITDGVKAKDMDEKVKVKDISEILLENVE